MAAHDANGSTGWRKFFGGVAAGSIAAMVAALLTVGGERQRVLDHVNTTEPLRQQTAIHIVDEQKHLDASEAAVLATIPMRLTNLERQVDELNRKADLLLVRQTSREKETR